ncbi:MAG: hypothetical protein V3T17_00385 [Pseudomonadales bacterium]
MSEPKLGTKDQASSLSSALTSYYDEFADFNEDCAFLCDAFVCLTANHENLDQYSIQGFERNALWLKRRVNELKESLKKIRELASANTS